ncbi:MAG: ankyrin repeat domain-containing protein [Epsilonproteobacteria bacterium]|nr:ankyrin repeat domain-containing protein [Campylobacterota bacterium]
MGIRYRSKPVALTWLCISIMFFCGAFCAEQKGVPVVEKSYFESLPTEILVLILGYLELRDILIFSLLNRNCSALTQQISVGSLFDKVVLAVSKSKTLPQTSKPYFDGFLNRLAQDLSVDMVQRFMFCDELKKNNILTDLERQAFVSNIVKHLEESEITLDGVVWGCRRCLKLKSIRCVQWGAGTFAYVDKLPCWLGDKIAQLVKAQIMCDIQLLNKAVSGQLDETDLKNLLVAGADINACDHEGKTALHWALYKGHYELVQSLLDHGADGCVRDDQGRSPLHYAAESANLACVNKLLEKNVVVDVTDVRAQTPLHYAAYSSPLNTTTWDARVEMVKLLVACGASHTNVDLTGRNALAYAMGNHHLRAYLESL